jgi:hypothetical protein
MLKTISAALLAASVFAAPALAAGSTDQAPGNKTTQAPVNKANQAPTNKTTQAKPSTSNANAKMSRHVKHVSHHRSHKNMSALKTHKQVSTKHAAPATKRG